MTGIRLWFARVLAVACLSFWACASEEPTSSGASGANDIPAGPGAAGFAGAGGALPPVGSNANAATAAPTAGGAAPAQGNMTQMVPGEMPPVSGDSMLTPGDNPTLTPGDNAMAEPADNAGPIDETEPAPIDETMDEPGPTMTPQSGVADLSGCPPPPDGSSTSVVEAWTILNEIRLAAGSTCMNMVPELISSAQSHCDYRARHSGTACDVGAHSESAGCEGYTGSTVGEREIAAGYPRQLAYTEVALTYGDNPTAAIPGWLVTPFHRIPLLDPWSTDMGWGGAAGCDVIDVGRGMDAVPDDVIVVYPYDGQVDVPPTFNGLEAPAPPQPAGGWPSSYPVSIYAKELAITEHVLTKDGDETPLDHMWLDARAPEVNAGLRAYFTTTAMLYGAPFEANTTYRVRMAGTYVGGALNVEWTFTTGAARPAWF